MLTQHMPPSSARPPQAARTTRPFFARTGGPMRRFLARIPRYAYAGLVLNIAAWAVSWAQIKPFSAYTFFPLWFGFILLLDGVNVARSGSSFIRRSPARFALMFVLSSPFWWIFEALNAPVQNWHYLFDHHYSPLAYVLNTSLDFSTVLPAVLEIATLLMSFRALRPRLAPNDPGPRLALPPAAAIMLVGVLCIVLPALFPGYAFPLVWFCLIFLCDPINNLLRRKSAFGHLLAGDWRFIVALPLAALCCGFFWEMWNYFALPKWYYTVPFMSGVPHLFEMPLPGFLGYLPFAVELFAMYQLALWVLRQRNDLLTF